MLKNTTIHVLLLFNAFMLSCGPDNNKVATFDSFFHELSDRGQFNGNVLIAEGNQIIFHKAFGYADFEKKKKLTTKSVFELASLSKQFTAMAIMILKERGELAYEDDMNSYLPTQLPYKNISIRHLLSHTSGLPDYQELFEQHWDKTKIADNADILSMLAKFHPPVLFNPGESYKYSNTGYVLLASVVETVSQMPFDRFLKENIFIPLQMVDTAIYTKEAVKKIDNYAFGYMYSLSDSKYLLTDDIPSKSYVYYLSGRFGPGRMSSTTFDLYKWDRALYTEKLVSKATLVEAFTPMKTTNLQTDYGFGWHIIENDESEKAVFHTGTWGGYLNYIKRFIDEDKTIIILTNNHQIAYIKQIRIAAEQILYNQPFQTPKISIVERLSNNLINQDEIALNKQFNQLIADSGTYYLDENELADLGNELIDIDKAKQAVSVFQIYASENPSSWKVYDGLARAYALAGENKLAVENRNKAEKLKN